MIGLIINFRKYGLTQNVSFVEFHNSNNGFSAGLIVANVSEVRVFVFRSFQFGIILLYSTVVVVGWVAHSFRLTTDCTVPDRGRAFLL
jgi:hypothetical protein